MRWGRSASSKPAAGRHSATAAATASSGDGASSDSVMTSPSHSRSRTLGPFDPAAAAGLAASGAATSADDLGTVSSAGTVGKKKMFHWNPIKKAVKSEDELLRQRSSTMSHLITDDETKTSLPVPTIGPFTRKSFKSGPKPSTKARSEKEHSLSVTKSLLPGGSAPPSISSSPTERGPSDFAISPSRKRSMEMVTDVGSRIRSETEISLISSKLFMASARAEELGATEVTLTADMLAASEIPVELHRFPPQTLASTLKSNVAQLCADEKAGVELLFMTVDLFRKSCVIEQKAAEHLARLAKQHAEVLSNSAVINSSAGARTLMGTIDAIGTNAEKRMESTKHLLDIVIDPIETFAKNADKKVKDCWKRLDDMVEKYSEMKLELGHHNLAAHRAWRLFENEKMNSATGTIKKSKASKIRKKVQNTFQSYYNALSILDIERQKLWIMQLPEIVEELEKMRRDRLKMLGYQFRKFEELWMLKSEFNLEELNYLKTLEGIFDLESTPKCWLERYCQKVLSERSSIGGMVDLKRPSSDEGASSRTASRDEIKDPAKEKELWSSTISNMGRPFTASLPATMEELQYLLMPKDKLAAGLDASAAEPSKKDETVIVEDSPDIKDGDLTREPSKDDAAVDLDDLDLVRFGLITENSPGDVKELKLEGLKGEIVQILSEYPDGRYLVKVARSYHCNIQGWIYKSIVQELYVGHDIRFTQLIHIPLGAEYFAEFLKTEFSEENYLFWKEAGQYYDSWSRGLAVTIAEKYIGTSAPLQINIKNDTADRIWDRIRSGEIAQEIFVEAQKEIFEVMRQDPFERFRKSVLFKKFLTIMENAPAKKLTSKPLSDY